MTDFYVLDYAPRCRECNVPTVLSEEGRVGRVHMTWCRYARPPVLRGPGESIDDGPDRIEGP